MIICPNCNYHDLVKVNILGYDQCTNCGYVFPEKRHTQLTEANNITPKSCVRDFLEYLAQHEDEIIVTEKHKYTYSSLRESIIKTLQMAYGDGEVKGFNDCQEQELFDKTLISGKKDW